MPESEGEQAEGDVNLVEVQQDPNQSSEYFTTDCASEGKPWSITPLSNLYIYVCYACAFKFQELFWNHSCMSLGAHVLLLVWQDASCHALRTR